MTGGNRSISADADRCYGATPGALMRAHKAEGHYAHEHRLLGSSAMIYRISRSQARRRFRRLVALIAQDQSFVIAENGRAMCLLVSARRRSSSNEVACSGLQVITFWLEISAFSLDQQTPRRRFEAVSAQTWCLSGHVSSSMFATHRRRPSILN